MNQNDSLSLNEEKSIGIGPDQTDQNSSFPDEQEVIDAKKRRFLKILGGGALGLLATSILSNKASALVVGSTPTSNVVGVKDSSNTRINPATDETLQSVLIGQGITKVTISLSGSGIVRTPASGKKIRVYANRFTLSTDATAISFRFTAIGTDYERYTSPKAGGLYGANNHPNYIEGGIDEVLYCTISGVTTIQVNVDYKEV